MPNDPLETDNLPVTPPSRESKNVCEFCGCTLTPRGEVLKMGEQAKNFRKHEEVVEKKDKEISRLNTEITELTRERDALKAAQGSGGGQSGHRPGGRIQN